jgi:hypothetical protein
MMMVMMMMMSDDICVMARERAGEERAVRSWFNSVVLVRSGSVGSFYLFMTVRWTFVTSSSLVCRRIRG